MAETGRLIDLGDALQFLLLLSIPAESSKSVPRRSGIGSGLVDICFVVLSGVLGFYFLQLQNCVSFLSHGGVFLRTPFSFLGQYLLFNVLDVAAEVADWVAHTSHSTD